MIVPRLEAVPSRFKAILTKVLFLGLSAHVNLSNATNVQDQYDRSTRPSQSRRDQGLMSKQRRNKKILIVLVYRTSTKEIPMMTRKDRNGYSNVYILEMFRAPTGPKIQFLLLVRLTHNIKIPRHPNLSIRAPAPIHSSIHSFMLLRTMIRSRTRHPRPHPLKRLKRHLQSRLPLPQRRSCRRRIWTQPAVPVCRARRARPTLAPRQRGWWASAVVPRQDRRSRQRALLRTRCWIRKFQHDGTAASGLVGVLFHYTRDRDGAGSVGACELW